MGHAACAPQHVWMLHQRQRLDGRGIGNDIGSLPGNKASVNDGTPGINYVETNDLWVWVPIWDFANGNGSNGYYHIVGYSAFEIVHIKGGKDIEGVLRLAVDPATGNP